MLAAIWCHGPVDRAEHQAAQHHGDDIPAFLAPLARAGDETSAGLLTVAMMVSSVDGRATIANRVGGLTGKADQQVLLGAREMAAAVVVGGSTVKAEGYDRLLDDQARARRRAIGLPPEPELVVYTRASPPLPDLFNQLKGRHPGGLIVCEGGPTVLGMIVDHCLLDQLVLTLSPMLVADDTQKRIIEQHTTGGAELQLLATASDGGFLFLRYGVTPT